MHPPVPDAVMSSTIRARRRFGQNFLVDASAVRRIVDVLDPAPGEPVLEIGPGRGALTAELIRRTGRIAAVEVDRDLAARLTERFDPESLVLLTGDVLELDWEAVSAKLAARGRPLAVAGNLPYNISKPVAMRLVERRRHVARAVLTFQREVAERLTARPGEAAYGPLGILVGQAFEVRAAFRLRPGAFRPRPAVVSTVTRWTRREAGGILDRDAASLRACLRACFAQRRRTLFNNLRLALGDARRVDSLLARAGLDGALRPARLAPADYVRLAGLWPAEPRR